MNSINSPSKRPKRPKDLQAKLSYKNFNYDSINSLRQFSNVMLNKNQTVNHLANFDELIDRFQYGNVYLDIENSNLKNLKLPEYPSRRRTSSIGLLSPRRCSRRVPSLEEAWNQVFTSDSLEKFPKDRKRALSLTHIYYKFSEEREKAEKCPEDPPGSHHSSKNLREEKKVNFIKENRKEALSKINHFKIEPLTFENTNPASLPYNNIPFNSYQTRWNLQRKEFLPSSPKKLSELIKLKKRRSCECLRCGGAAHKLEKPLMFVDSVKAMRKQIAQEKKFQMKASIMQRLEDIERKKKLQKSDSKGTFGTFITTLKVKNKFKRQRTRRKMKNRK